MTEADRYYDKMTKTPVSRLIVTLGIPTTVSMLITNIYNLADTYFVGGLGTSQQGATGILFTLQCVIQALAFMLGHGSGTYVSRALADKDTDEATKYVSTAFFTGLFFGGLLTLFGLIFLEPFMRLLGSTETILPYAKDYGMWVLISCPFLVSSLVLNNNLRYEGKAVYAMIGLTSGGILNIFGDWLFIRVMGLGVFGAGMSTAISQTVSFVLLFLFYKLRAQSRVSIRAVSFSFSVHFEIIKGGLPSLFRQGLASLSNGLLNNFTKPFGDAAIAAMSVVNRFSSFVMCVGLGIGQGFQPVSSFNYRAREYARVKRGLVFTMAFGALLVGILGLGGIIFSSEIVYVFQKDPAVIEIGERALAYGCIGVMMLPVSVPVNMLYQSIRKSGIASILSVLRSGALFIPVLVYGAGIFGLDGIMWAQPIADILTAVVSVPFIVAFLVGKHEDEEDR